MRRKAMSLILLGLLLSVPVLARDVKVKIEGNLADAVKLVEQLNENGKKHNLRFILTDSDYEFRIAIGSEGWSKWDTVFGGGADASAAVLTPNCELLFIVSRSGRWGQSGALNAVSKEIVKKLLRYFEALGKE